MTNKGCEKLWEPEECPVCGKKFIRAPEHIYMVTTKKGFREYVCSYSCMRVLQEQKYGKKAAKEKKRIQEELKGIYGRK